MPLDFKSGLAVHGCFCRDLGRAAYHWIPVRVPVRWRSGPAGDVSAEPGARVCGRPRGAGTGPEVGNIGRGAQQLELVG